MSSARRVAAPRRTVLVLLITMLVAIPALAEVYYWGDGAPDGKRSIGGGGHATFFDVGADDRWLNVVELFGSRYGGAQPPDEEFHLYVMDIDRTILAEVALPYSLWERGDEYWRDLPIPPIQVPRQFGIGLTFNAEQTKGVFVGTDAGPSYSYAWVPGVEGQPVEGLNWMIRVTVNDDPVGDPGARDLLVLAEGDAFFDSVTGIAEDGSVQTAAAGTIAADQIASLRFDAFRSSGAGGVTVLLTSGAKLRGKLLGIDAATVRLEMGGQERALARETVARIDF